jgi:hypothetical protein
MQWSQADTGASDSAHAALPMDARHKCTRFVRKVKGLNKIPYPAPPNDIVPRPEQLRAELRPMRLDTLTSFASPGYATMRVREWGVCTTSVAAHLAGRRLRRSWCRT